MNKHRVNNNDDVCCKTGQDLLDPIERAARKAYQNIPLEYVHLHIRRERKRRMKELHPYRYYKKILAKILRGITKQR